MAQPDLGDLLARCGLGDRQAFSALYDFAAPKLFGVCLRMLKDRAVAEDALQETFVKIWRNAARFAAGQAAPMTWMVAIARNQSIDMLRAGRRVHDELDEAGEIADPSPDPERMAVLAGEGAAIGRCLGELEAPQAAAVVGAYVEGLSYDELARRHGVPLNTMRTWLRRSLLKLRGCLER